MLLRTVFPQKVSIVWYDNDTLIFTEGECFERAVRLAEHMVARVIAKIHRLAESRESSQLRPLCVDGEDFQISRCFKYFDLTITAAGPLIGSFPRFSR